MERLEQRWTSVRACVEGWPKIKGEKRDDEAEIDGGVQDSQEVRQSQVSFTSHVKV